jgi:class 3 adenylate cyclase
VTTHAERHIYAFDLDLDALWRAVSDTDTFDRDAGLPAVHYRYEPRANGPPGAVARARFGPVTSEWEESPLAWEAPLRLAVERRFRRGPVTRFAGEMRLFPDGAGARIEHSVELDVRGPLGVLLARPLLAYARARVERAYRRAEHRARTLRQAGTRDDASDEPRGSIAGVARFVDALEALPAHTEDEPAIAARLAALVERGPRASVVGMRPYELADGWNLPREHVIAAMLAAARAGLLTSSWTILCPRCRVPRAAVPALSGLGSTVHCEVCEITFAGDFDRNVELTFDAPPPVHMPDAGGSRPLRPQASRQILAQRAIEASGTAAFDVVLHPGAYVVQVLPDRVTRFTVEEDAGAAGLEARIGPTSVSPSASVVHAGTVRFQIANTTADNAVVRVVEAELPRSMATAANVTALQVFRDLFPDEVFAGDAQGAIRSLTFVCCDVVGLDGIAEEFGDAHAARIVRSALDALREPVVIARGAIVKTSGDGLTAVFTDPRDAVGAALHFGEAAVPLELRIALDRGPCIALTANGRLDYFGATVNHAARLARAARAGELLLTNVLAEDPRVAELVPTAERGIVTLRGVMQPVDVLRVRTESGVPAR